MRKVLGPAFAALLILSGWSRARASDETKLFDYRDITLENGLRVITLEDFSCPIAAVQMWYHVGSKNDPPDRKGFAHMFEHMMFRGTDRLGPTDHFDYIHSVGGDCNAFTSFDQTVYVAKVPANQLELVLWLEAERMAFLRIDRESFDTERRVVEEELRVHANEPYGTALEQVLAAAFKLHPYRWPPLGNIPDLRKAAVEELRDFWLEYYVPNNATLVIAGAVKHGEAQRLARRYLGWIPRGEDPARVTVREPLPTRPQSVTIKERNAPLPVVGVAYRTGPAGEEDQIPLIMLQKILGEGRSSRLYRTLVAEKRLARGTGLFVSRAEQDGLFVAGAALPPFWGKAKKTVKVIEAEFERLRTEPITERELTKVRNQMLREMVKEKLTVVSKARMLGMAAVIEGDVSRVNHYFEQAQRITGGDLMRVAQTHFDPGRVFRGRVKRNLLGTFWIWLRGRFGRKKDGEAAPIKTRLESAEALPGRRGLRRPENFPDRPPLAPYADYNVTPEHTAQELPNGLKVMVVPNDEVPFVNLKLGFKAGACSESKPGAASMTMQMLTKGTARQTEGELAEELDTHAISLGGKAGMDTCSVDASCLSQHLGRAVELMSEVVQTPSFPEEELEKLQEQMLAMLRVSRAQPSYIADREFQRRLFGEHPYARAAGGEEKDVKAVRVEDLKEWWGRFVRPDMGVLIFSGDVEESQALELARTWFGGWKATGSQPEIRVPELPAGSDTHIYLVNLGRSDQSQIRVGQLGITRHHPGYFTSQVVNGYFGGSFGSRLNEGIRVKRGLTYGISGGYSYGRFAGKFKVSTFSKTATTAAAVRAIFDELERLRAEPPSDEELEMTRSYILGSFVAKRETPQQVADDLWTVESNGLPEDFFDKMLEQVGGAEGEDCMRLVGEKVDPSRMVVVVAGNARKLEKELREVAPVTVVRASAKMKRPRRK